MYVAMDASMHVCGYQNCSICMCIKLWSTMKICMYVLYICMYERIYVRIERYRFFFSCCFCIYVFMYTFMYLVVDILCMYVRMYVSMSVKQNNSFQLLFLIIVYTNTVQRSEVHWIGRSAEDGVPQLPGGEKHRPGLQLLRPRILKA